jgi:6-pyruvoyltetrahydropterin/6-carboxytetrahydropterin synthase
MLTITKIFRFEAAHALTNYPGQCKNIHGHSYELHVSVGGHALNELNMIYDFKELKQVVHQTVLEEFDHALILKRETGYTPAIQQLNLKTVWLDEEPTAEYLVSIFAARILKLLPQSIELYRLRLYETNTSYVDWTPSNHNF